MSTLRVISIGHITDPLVLGSNTPPFLCSSECVKNPERKPLVSTIFAITLALTRVNISQNSVTVYLITVPTNKTLLSPII